VLAAETLASPADGVVVVARVDDTGLVLAAVRAEQFERVLSGDGHPLHLVVPSEYSPILPENEAAS